MVGLLLFQILLLGITGSQGQDCNCDPCKYVPNGDYEGGWDLVESGSLSCPTDDPSQFGCLYTKYETSETKCFCDPGPVTYEVCSMDNGTTCGYCLDCYGACVNDVCQGWCIFEDTDDVFAEVTKPTSIDLVLTGGDNNGERLSSSEMITSAGVCSLVNPDPIPSLTLTTSGGSSDWLNGSLLVFCGGSNTFKAHTYPINQWGSTSTCFSLKQGQNQWSSTQLCGPTGCGSTHQNDMSSERAWFSLTTVNNTEMIAIGGIDDRGNVLNTMETYSVTTNTWTTLSHKLSNARFGHCTVQSSPGHVIVMGGSYEPPQNGQWIITNAVNAIDVETGSINTLMNLPEALWAPACTVHSGFIYVSGGSSGSQHQAQNTVYRYSLSTKKWSPAVGTGLNFPRWGHVMGTTSNNQLVVAGGYDPATGTFYNSIESSNDDGDTWTVRATGLNVNQEYPAMAEVPAGTFTCP